MIYIAGPYRASTKLGIIINILKARKVAKKYWALGYTVITPHSNSALMDGCATDEVFLRGGLDLLECAKLMVVLKGWEKSQGTIAEIEYAKEHSIPIIYRG